MIYCKDLDREFSTKRDMFIALKENKDTIVGIKKSAVKFSDPISFTAKDISTAKAGSSDSAVKIGDFIYPVINTTNYLDSHGDVHLDGIWNKSLTEQNGKVYYIINHELEIGKVISYPKEVTPMVKDMSWSELGLPYEGKTQALIFKARLTDKTNHDALKAIIDKESLENSIRMMYVGMKLCIDSNDEELKEEKKDFYNYLPIIANKEDAIERGYFWAITEAKIFKEGSAVLFGSNDATPILYNLDKDIDPEDSSQDKADPVDPVDKTQIIHFDLI